MKRFTLVLTAIFGLFAISLGSTAARVGTPPVAPLAPATLPSENTYDFSITKTDSADPVAATGSFNYVLNVTNNTSSAYPGTTVRQNTAINGIPHPAFSTGPGIATLYPATVTMPSGLGTITGMSVNFEDLNHTFTGDIDVVLVSPTGKRIFLMTDFGGGCDAVNTDIVWSDAGSDISSCTTLGSGTYIPQHDGSYDTTIPGSTTVSNFAGFNGDDPGGTWSLYIYDDAGSDSGSLSGWSLNITTNGGLVTVSDTLPSGFTYSSASGTGWSCSYSSGTHSVTCTRSSFSASSSSAITISGTAPSEPTTLSNSASVSISNFTDTSSANNSATQSTTVNAAINLGVSVTDSPDPVVAGNSVSYGITVSNAGPSTASGIAVSHVLPTSSSYSSFSGTGWSCSYTSATRTVSCTNSNSLPSGLSLQTLTIVAVLNESGTNTATTGVSATQTDTSSANNSATTTTTVDGRADLAVTGSDSPDPVVAGQQLTYSFRLTNNGPSTATGVSFSLPAPTGTTFSSGSATSGTCSVTSSSVTCSPGNLASGAFVDYTFVVNVAGTTRGTLSATATASGSLTDSNSSNSTLTLTTAVSAQVNLGLTLSDSPDPVAATGALAYTINVSNSGASTATGASVVLTLPAGTTYSSFSGTNWSCTYSSGPHQVTCTFTGSLATSASTNLTVNVTAPSNGGTISASATVTSLSTETDTSSSNNTDTETTTVIYVAGLSVAITDTPDPVALDATLRYSITVTNSGPSDANSVVLTDTLPAQVAFISVTDSSCSHSSGTVSCSFGTLSAGSSRTFSIFVYTQAAGTASNTVTVSTTSTDSSSADNSATATTTIYEAADLALSLSDAPDPVSAQGTYAYTLVVSNAGPDTARSVQVVTTLPSGVSYTGTSSAGWSCSYNSGTGQVTCTASSALADGASSTLVLNVTAPASSGSISASATASTSSTDANSGNNTATTTTTVTAVANLSLSKSATATVDAESLITYTLTVANAGPSTATSIALTDTLPTGVTFVSVSGTSWTCNELDLTVYCSLGSLASGGSSQVRIVVRAPAQGTMLTNSAVVSSAATDTDSANNSASASTTVTSVADLSIAKSGTAAVDAGATITYTLQVANAGPSTATPVTVTDTLPTGVTLVSASGSGWTCAGTATVTCTATSLASGSTSTIMIVVTAPSQGTTLTNSATVSSGTADRDSSDNSASASTTVTSVADLSITKSGTASVAAGGTITYLLDVMNVGPSTATPVTVTDTLPTGVTLVSASGSGWTCAGTATVTCTATSLASGSTGTIAIVVTAPSEGTTLTNSATVSSGTADRDSSDNTATASTTVTGVADLSLSKSGTASVDADGLITYTLTVANAGPSTATSIALTDALPSGVTFVSASGISWICNEIDLTVYCSLGSLASGGSSQVRIVVRAPDEGTTLTNSASVSSAITDNDSSDNSASASTTVTSVADLSITKTGTASVDAGGTMTYTLQVGNAGPSTATPVTVTDTLPTGVTLVSASGGGWTCAGTAAVTCSTTSLANGSTSTITIVVTAPSEGTTLTNSAVVSSGTADRDASDNSASASTTVTSVADLSITKSGTASVAAGGTITYLLDVMNAGPSAATPVTVTDTLPTGVTLVSASGSGWTCAGTATVTCTATSLASGSTGTITIVVTAPSEGTTLTNSTTVSSGTADRDSSDNTSSASTTVTGVADLALSKSAAAEVDANQLITYTLVVTNGGPSTATSIVLTDTLPTDVTFVSVSGTGWSCNELDQSVYCWMSSLASGGSAQVRIVVRAPLVDATLTNSASVSSAVADDDSSDNTASATTAVTAVADLSITKSGTASVDAAETITYTLQVANAGPSVATAVTVTDTLPTGVTPVSASGSGWTCSVAMTITCDLSSLSVGSAGDITIVVTAPDEGGTITNTATVSSGTADRDSSDNTSSASTDVAAVADLSIVKRAPATVDAASTITYTLQVSNAGPSTATPVTVTDTLPDGVTLVSASGTDWSCSTTAPIICELSSLAVGSSTIEIVVTAPDEGVTITNTATITSSTADDDTSNNSSSAATSVTAVADLSIVKSAPSTADAGATITYTLDITNAGPSTAAPVTVTDTLPDGVTVISASGSDWSCSTATPIICELGSLAVGSSTIEIVVTAPDEGGTITNTATIASSTADPDSTDNSSSAETTVSALADLSIVKSGPSAVEVGGTITYTLDITNAGPSTAAPVTVTDTLPDGVTLVSTSGADWTCSGSTTITCEIGSLAVGSSTIEIVVTAPGASTTLTNTATVSSDTADPDSANNSSSVETVVDELADLSISKTAEALVEGGATFTYTLVITNSGPSIATPVTVTDELPAGLTLVSASGTDWSCSTTTPIICALPSLDGDATSTIAIVVTAPDASVVLINTATVTSSVADDDASNNSASATTTVEAIAYGQFLPLIRTAGGAPDLVASFSLSPDQSSYNTTDQVLITVVVTNQGTANAGPFWVDFYINPTSPPTQANQPWNTRCTLTPCQGVAWEVQAGLAAGQSITLTSTADSYVAGNTRWSGSFIAGTSDLYVFVDSWNPGVAAGRVAESSEANNLAERHGLSVSGALTAAQRELRTLAALAGRE